MIAVADRRDAWVGLSPDRNDYGARAYGWQSRTINESEMALFHECTPQCAQKELDTADIVRDAIFRQLSATAQIFYRFADSKPETLSSYELREFVRFLVILTSIILVIVEDTCR